MKKILKLIEEYEEKNDKDCVSVTLFSDGSGWVECLSDDTTVELFEFNNIKRLINELKTV